MDVAVRRPLMHDHGPRHRVATVHHVTDPEPDQTAIPELAVDDQVKHRQVAGSVPTIEADPDDPDFLQLERWFRVDQFPLVPGFR